MAMATFFALPGQKIIAKLPMHNYDHLHTIITCLFRLLFYYSSLKSLAVATAMATFFALPGRKNNR